MGHPLYEVFLNHLHDDEQSPVVLSTKVVFLNHLHDDERNAMTIRKQESFLNHLHDDELKQAHQQPFFYFLNHLHDDERVQSHNLGSNAGTNPVTGRDKSTAQANSILASLEAARGKDK